MVYYRSTVVVKDQYRKMEKTCNVPRDSYRPEMVTCFTIFRENTISLYIYVVYVLVVVLKLNIFTQENDRKIHRKLCFS